MSAGETPTEQESYHATQAPSQATIEPRLKLRKKFACVWRITDFPKNQQFATHRIESPGAWHTYAASGISVRRAFTHLRLLEKNRALVGAMIFASSRASVELRRASR